MVLSKRERYIVIGVALAGAALALDYVAVTPVWEGIQKARADKASLAAGLDASRDTLERSKRLAPWWQDKLVTGVKSDPSEAEIQVVQAIYNWALECGVTPGPTKPDRPTEKTLLPEIAVQFTGTGRMSAVRSLLWRMHNAPIPVRITEVTLTTRKPGADDLTVQLRFSTVYLPGAKRPGAQSRPAPTPSSTTGAAR